MKLIDSDPTTMGPLTFKFAYFLLKLENLRFKFRYFGLKFRIFLLQSEIIFKRDILGWW